MHEQGLATLLEGAGYTSNIFECEFQKLFLLWLKKAVKLGELYIVVCINTQSINGQHKNRYIVV